ncbi:MAG: LPS assembly lipoprotein LptE [Candidatus Omnitrophica bacterium]|nr:LPS assembly lipoprotein LptE [Candidatus Omnitrophota bacterium]
MKKINIPSISLFSIAIYYLISTLFWGCGYTTHSLISSKYKTIYVSHFVNKIDIAKETESMRRYKVYYPLIEHDVRKAVIERFNLDGSLRISPEEHADLILKGTVLDFRRDALRYLVNDEVEEYRISITVEIELEDKNKNTLIEKSRIIGDTTYFLNGPHAKAEPVAIDEALKDVARRIVECVVERW